MAAHESVFDQYFYVDETDDFKFTKTICSLSPKKVIFNDPATIVYWLDGSKTVVKCSNGDVYDREKGFAMCVLKRLYGDKLHAMLKKYVQQEDAQEKNSSTTITDESSNVIFELIFDYYEDAKTVLFTLIELIKNYGFAYVSDLYDLINSISTYEDTKRGWYDLTSADIKHTSDGYVLDLPRPVKRI
ncbi:MAG: hypothetical protein SO274_05410 [Turicibacter bilis]|nr:hypothetical protein [Turicibacter bilis]